MLAAIAVIVCVTYSFIKLKADAKLIGQEVDSFDTVNDYSLLFDNLRKGTTPQVLT